MILLESVSHAQAMKYMHYIVSNMKNDIVEIIFRKKNGQMRKMKIHFSKNFVEKTVKNSKLPQIISIKKTNELRDNMVVCEITNSGKYQFRTVPLKEITKINKGSKEDYTRLIKHKKV